jgi:hypothetical protein
MGIGEPKIVVGPVLYFRGEQGDRWRLSALFVLEGKTEPGDLVVTDVGLPVPPRHVFVWRNHHVWRFDFSVPRTGHDRRIGYGFGSPGPWQVVIPGQMTRLRLAYTAGNGVFDDPFNRPTPARRDAVWLQLLEAHRHHPFHLLLQGGDQVYADTLWRDCPNLVTWWQQPEARRFTLPFTRAMADEAMDFFFQLYCRTLSAEAYGRALSTIPSIMIWDDHEIFDGWGSRPEVEQQSLVYRGLFNVARRHFSMFQIGAAVRDHVDSLWGAAAGTFHQALRVGDVGILALDLRSERTRTQVLSPQTWADLPGWLQRFQGCRHLLLMSSLPLGFAGSGWIGRLIGALPGHAHRDDDMRDHWRHPSHQAEWLRLLETLAGFSLSYRCRVTVLSGEFQVGAHGMIRGRGAELWQLMTGGVGHEPLSGPGHWGLDGSIANSEKISDDLTLSLPRFGESGKRLIRARGFLDLGFDRQNHLLARWHTEAEPAHYHLVI